MNRTRASGCALALRAIAHAFLLLLFLTTVAAALPDENWSAKFGLAGTDAEVLCSVVWNGDLVVGGRFGLAGDLPAAAIARWDGAQWQPLGEGFNDAVYAVAVWNGQLYAGGSFTASGATSLGGLARWNGTGWDDVGGGVYGSVATLLGTPGDLAVGGNFSDTAGLSGANNIALWNGSAWSGLGGGLDGMVRAVAVHDAQLVAGGDFTGRVAAFDGASWNTVGGGLPDGSTMTQVNAMASQGGLLYVGGAFDPTIGGTQLLNIAGWDGTQWQALSSGLDGPVQTLGAWDGKLVIGGSFYNPVFRLGTWDGWNFEYPGGVTGVGWYGGDYVNTVAASATKLYVGGVLNLVAPSTYGANVFAFDGTSYTSLGEGNALYGNVRSFGKWNGSVYAGGSFGRSSNAGDLNGIARWTGSRWESVGGGVQASGWYELRVNGIDSFGSDLLLTGQFDHTLSGSPLHNVARWNGSTWTSPGGGFASETYRSIVYQNEMWVAGGYQELLNHGSGNLWKWSGTAWQAQGGGDFGLPFALAEWNGKLIIGGVFASVGGVPANCVAMWNGSSWSALGAGLNAAVSNLIVSNGELYASGEFWLSGSDSVPGIARWNGTKWVSVGGGVSSNWAAHALGSGAGSLWQGGSWDQIGGVPGYNNVARWDGSSWSALGSGTNGPVLALFVDGSDVWAGGMFSQAGGRFALRVSRWTAAASGVPEGATAQVAFRLAPPVPNPSTGNVSLAFSLPEAASGNVRVYDLRGRLVASLAQGSLDAGRHVVSWDGRANDGSSVASGVYWAVLTVGGRQASTRVVRVK